MAYILIFNLALWSEITPFVLLFQEAKCLTITFPVSSFDMFLSPYYLKIAFGGLLCFVVVKIKLF